MTPPIGQIQNSKMRNVISMALSLVIVCACGCAGERGIESRPPKYVHLVRFESDPPGMRIYYGSGGEIKLAEKNISFIGLTPCEKKIGSTKDGDFEIEGVTLYNSFRPAVAVFICEPPYGQANLFRQEKSYHSEAHFIPADRVPDAVFFDMHKP